MQVSINYHDDWFSSKKQTKQWQNQIYLYHLQILISNKKNEMQTFGMHCIVSNVIIACVKYM